MNPVLIDCVKNVLEYTTNADDRAKAGLMLSRIKTGNIEDEDCINFLFMIDSESLIIPKNVTI